MVLTHQFMRGWGWRKTVFVLVVADRHHFVGIELGLWDFLDLAHRLIDNTKDLNDNVFCRHGGSPTRYGFDTSIVGSHHDDFNLHHWLYKVFTAKFESHQVHTSIVELKKLS